MDFAKEILAQNWPEWEIVEQIGAGSYGKVYKIKREYLGGRKEFSALKVIRIPPKGDSVSFTFDTSGATGTKDYYKSLALSIADEIELMTALKGRTNIVSYEDQKVIEDEDGWTILIRMELLTPLTEYFSERFPTQDEVVKLGVDICNALIICSGKNIIHRDIKPANVFVSDNGDFKLGDFGTAKITERTIGAGSVAGTYSYMAPEILKLESYNAQVDIYSLGTLLYEYLNKKRLPFYPPYPQECLFPEIEKACVKKLSGETLPPPCDAEEWLSKVVLKATSFNPKDRFLSAEEMKAALEKKPRKKIGKKLKKALLTAAGVLGVAAVVTAGVILIPPLFDDPIPKIKNEGLEYGNFIYDEYNIEARITGLKECSETLEIPTEINGKPVKVIEDEAFANQTMVEVIIPEGVTEVGDCAFINCAQLESAVLPQTVNEIGERAFADCVSLKKIEIKNSMYSIGDRAFSGCKRLSTVIFNGNVYLLGENVFESTPYKVNCENMLEKYKFILEGDFERGAEYVLYDMNSDGIKELIVHVNGDGSKEGFISFDKECYEIYTFTNIKNELEEESLLSFSPNYYTNIPSETVQKSFDCICEAKDRSGFYGYTNDDGYEEICLVAYNGEDFEITTVKESVYVGEGELPGEKIEFVADVSDTMPLENEILKLVKKEQKETSADQ